MTQQSDPDWKIIVGAVAAVATAVTTVWVRVRGGKKDEEHEKLRLNRDTAGTDTTTETLQGASWLLKELRDELGRSRTDLDKCALLTSNLMVEVGGLEQSKRDLEQRNRDLEHENRDLKRENLRLRQRLAGGANE